MATSYTFNGRLIKLPGVYAQVKSAVSNTPVDLSYGNILIVDTIDSDYSGGAGINGQLASGEDSVYEFDNVVDFRAFVRGGIVWDIALPLFRPFGSGNSGVSRLFYVRPFDTTASRLDLVFTNGTFKIASRHEGKTGNGVEVGSMLTRGLSANLEKGIFDTSKFRVRFLRGTYTGVDQDNRSYNGLSETESTPETIALTPEISTLEELANWMLKNYDFNNAFVLEDGSTNTGTIVAGDLTTLASSQLFSGGTQTYSEEALLKALESVKNLDYTHILSVDYDTNMLSLRNFSLLYHIESEARFEKFLVIGGAQDKDGFGNSRIAAKDFNSDKVILVHGANLETDRVLGTGYRQKTSLHKAAYVLGRTAGLEPQTPPTLKGLGYSGEVHKLTDREREQALDDGVLTTYYDTDVESFVITQGINTLQKNDDVINQDGTSHLWSLKRIAAQLNKEIEVNMKKQLLGNQSQGPNRNTLSEEVIEEWVVNYLRRKTATQTVDNLIISFRNVIVTPRQDTYWVSYEFEPNFEVNKIFVTGFIIDPNL